MKGHVRPRPIRLAFLVQDGEHAHLALDGIFSESYNRWGGRFSLIVPCVESRIPDDYWRWLERYDADIIYSFVALGREQILEIHERLNPAEYKQHWLDPKEPRLDVFGFRPDYSFPVLSSLSTIFRNARYRSPYGDVTGPLEILDVWHGEAPSKTITDNFGTYHWCRASGLFPPDARSAAHLLTVISPEKKADRRAGFPQDAPTVADEVEAIETFAANRAHSMSLASILYAPKLEVSAGDWSGAFNLVLGDGFEDRILFWNARQLIPGWLDNDLCCFRVTLDQLRDPRFAEALGKLLNRRNHVNYGSGGQSQTVIRSVSHSEQDLAEAHAIIQGLKTWGIIRTKKVGSLAEVIPTATALERAKEPLFFGQGYNSKADWVRFRWTPPTAHPPVTAPDHMVDVPPNQWFGEGFWASDYIFQHEGVGIRLGDQNLWMLPRRWRLAHAFSSEYVTAPRHQRPPAGRRSREGALCLFASAGTAIERITIPTPENAVQFALTRDGFGGQDDVPRGKVWPQPKARDSFPSNEARYLTGVLGLTGGLDEATSFLLHPFLRNVFARLGGTPNLPADKVGPTVNDLRKRAAGQQPFDLHNEQERTVLANMLLKAARWLKRPMAYVRLEALKTDWKAYRATYWAANPQPHGDKEVDWDAQEAASLDGCLVAMRRREIVFQGYQWSCGHCHHRNWINFDELESEPSCAICRTPTDTPVEIQWAFRPNEFLIESLRDHSVLSLIWVLSTLARRARGSFMYIGPTGFSFDEYDKLDAEADLIVLIDGEVTLCEVKASWSHLRGSDIRKLVALAKRFRPENAVLAVMEEGNVLGAEIEAARVELEAEGIRFSVMKFNEAAEHQDPHLWF